MRPSFYHHLHPPTIPAKQARFRYTLGAGGFSVYLVLMVGISGVLEMFYYAPGTQTAAQSIQNLTFLVPFGNIVRNLHFWSAQALVVVSGIHLLRVLFTGAYSPPRQTNYLIGLVCFVLILFLDFTGYGLRWDEGVRWALVAGTNLVKSIPFVGQHLYVLLVGGSELGEATIIRFYAWHIVGLTSLLGVMGVWHLFRIRRDGGIAVPPPGLRKDQARITRFELVRKEALAALIATILLLCLSLFAPAPLASPISDATIVSADSRAPWFFLWVQELLSWGNAFWMGVFLPAILLVFFALIPFIFKETDPSELGSWFPKSGRAVQVTVMILAFGILTLTVLAVR